MENKKYNNLKDELKQALSRFRLQLLFSDLLRGAIATALFTLFFLLLYFALVQFFLLTVLFKTIFYFLFLGGGSLLVCLFILYPVYRFFSYFDLRKSGLLKQILKALPGDMDLLVSLYGLAFTPELITGDNDLKKAAFIQKYEFLKNSGFTLSLPRRKIFRELMALALLLALFLGNGKHFNRLFTDMRAYQEVRNPKFDIDFHILNESLNVEYGKAFKLKLSATSEYLTIENVFICFGGGEFLMDKQDSLFVYDFEVLNNDVSFHFETSGAESKMFKISVLPTPEITNYEVTCQPPVYTGLKSEVLKNVVDFRVLYGSVLKFDIDVAEIDTLYLKSGDTFLPIALKSSSNALFSKSVYTSGEYALFGSNAHFIRKNLINFNVTCVPDLYPGIQLTEMEDSLRNSHHYFYGVISDDYGFSDLRFNYSIDGRNHTVMPVQIVKNRNTQEFYFDFDFAEFAGMDQAKIDYFFEIFDNDVLSGPKSTRSDAKNYQVPDLNTIFDYNIGVDNQVNSSLKEAEKLAKEIVSGVKELQKKMLDNSVDNWEKQQLSKDIVDKKEKLDKLLNRVKEENQKKSSLNQSFTGQDSVLLAKQDLIQKLMDNVMDEEMKKLMEEFSKLSEEFSKDKFQQLDEKMKLSFDQMSEELDRNIELLKQYQVEERHDMISQQVEKLKERQQNFEKQATEKSVSKDSLAIESKEMKDKLDKIKKDYNNLLEENKQLAAPYQLKNLDQPFDKLSQDVDKQEQNSSQGKQDKALSKEIEKEMKELSEELEKQKEKNFSEISLPESDIELIIQNILIISLAQEKLMSDFSDVPAQSSKYNELGRIQDLKKLEYKIVKDSLSVLAKSNLMLASILNDKFYDIEIKFGLLPQYIQDNKRSELKKEQQFIVNYLNDMALSLTDALQKNQAGSKGSGSSSPKKKGSKPGDKSGKEKGDGDQEGGYGQMKKFQQGMKQQLEGLISKMKSGEKGKPLQQGISNMIRENELFRKSLNDFISETGSLSNAEKQLLNEIGKLLEENIRDLANYSISGTLINRNNQIYNKLLISEKASKEREEYEEKRKSTTALEAGYKRPDLLFDLKKKSKLMKTDFRKSDIKLNSFYKNMYNNYYIKLGDE